jgi:hypothetical protein
VTFWSPWIKESNLEYLWKICERLVYI